jgi:hypothetical protein
MKTVNYILPVNNIEDAAGEYICYKLTITGTRKERKREMTKYLKALGVISPSRVIHAMGFRDLT